MQIELEYNSTLHLTHDHSFNIFRLFNLRKWNRLNKLHTKKWHEMGPGEKQPFSQSVTCQRWTTFNRRCDHCRILFPGCNWLKQGESCLVIDTALKRNSSPPPVDYKCGLTGIHCVCVRACTHASICQSPAVWNDTRKCRPTPNAHRTMGSTRIKLMDEQMNRCLNQWEDEKLDGVQDCSFYSSYATI